MKRPMNQPVIVLTQEERQELKRLARKNKVMDSMTYIVQEDQSRSTWRVLKLVTIQGYPINMWIFT